MESFNQDRGLGTPETSDSGPQDSLLREHGGSPSRRGILTTIGAVAFTFTAIGGFGGAPASSQTGGGGLPGCSRPELDDVGHTCPGPDGDCDANLALADNRDESCTGGGVFHSSETDEACQLVPNPSKELSGKDADESCGGSDQSADEACGDCNDDHDSDGNCGNTGASGATDSDELCGHRSYVIPPSNEDQACQDAEDTDQGCGVQSATYADPHTDADQGCGGTQEDPDHNCTLVETDVTCGQDPPPFGSAPDESCGVSGSDEGCGATFDPSYDADQGCSPTSPDESCGAGAGIGFPGSGHAYNDDESCSQTSTDDACGPIVIEFGVDVVDTDQHA